MGLMSWFRQERAVNKMVRDARRGWAKAAALSPDDLRQLPDEALYGVLEDRLLAKTQALSEEENLNRLNSSEQTFYKLMLFDMELTDGGLARFFMDAPEIAPQIGQALRVIGSHTLADRYEAFLRLHQIDPWDLSSFWIEDEEEFEAQAARYPFETFEKTYDREVQHQLLLKYAKEHLEEM